MKEQKNFTREDLDSVKELIAPAKDDFLALVPQVKKLIYPNSKRRGYRNHGIHGLGHIYRVLLLSLIYYYNSNDSLSPEDKNVLIYFAILHDVGRTNNLKDPSHGEKSLKIIRDDKIEIEGLNLTEEDKYIASLAIRGHCNGKGEQQVLDTIPEGRTRDRALKLFRICKDMDALDRVRLISGVDVRQLRTDYAKSMVDTATIIYRDHLARHLARLAESNTKTNFRVERANIVKVTADAIVLPANETLTCTSDRGAFGAIFKAAGKEKLEQACKDVLREQGKKRCATGSAVVTPAFNLDTEWVIHAVVPKWEGGEYEEYSELCSAYLSALALADYLKCSSIAFPLLASGQKHFSKKLAIQAAVECFKKFQGENLEEIILVVYDDSSVRCAKQLGYTVHETYSSPHKKHSHPKKHSHSKKGAQIAEAAKIVEAAMNWLADPKNQAMIKNYADLVMKVLRGAGLMKAGLL